MTQSIGALVWASSSISNSPIATYTVDFATDPEWNFTVESVYNDTLLRAQFVTIDNLASNQYLDVYFSNVRNPVLPFSRRTFPIPPGYTQCSVIGRSGANLTCTVIFAVANINQADQDDFSAIQQLAGDPNLQPIIYQTGTYNIAATDIKTIQYFDIVGPANANMPNVADIDNGFNVQVWNDDASTDNVTIVVPGGTTIDGAATLIVPPGGKYWIVFDGTDHFYTEIPQQQNFTIDVFVANGNWNKPDNLDFIEVEVVGGGGSGGSVAGAGVPRCAGGGGSGAYGRRRIAAALLGATEAVTIGAGGAAPAAGPFNGNAGGTSSFGAFVSCTGGAGGLSDGGGAGTQWSQGGAGGVAAGGDFNFAGCRGDAAYRSAAGTLSAYGGSGGQSFMGMPGIFVTVNSNGSPAVGLGAGGSGAHCFNDGVARSGGAGFQGVVIVRNYLK